MKSLLRKPVGFAVVDLGFRERKKLGHWMFLGFCGMCLFLGVLKICANGWFGSAIERAGSSQVGWLVPSQRIYGVFYSIFPCSISYFFYICVVSYLVVRSRHDYIATDFVI